MQDYYKLLSVESSATTDEIRRAYRVLARKYHPDLNAGPQAEELFKEISAAYNVLSDPLERRKYDKERYASQEAKGPTKKTARSKKTGYTRGGHPAFDPHAQQQKRARRSSSAAHRTTARTAATQQKTAEKAPPTNGKHVTTSTEEAASSFFEKSLGKLKKLFPLTSSENSTVSVVELTISVEEALTGITKSVTLTDKTPKRRVAVKIPAGVRSGSVVHMESKPAPVETLVAVIRLAPHPYLSMQVKGLVVEVPVTVQEAVEGTRIRVPTLSEPALISIPAGSQSGHEIRLRGHGPKLKDGSKGDIFYRLLVKVPEQPYAPGLSEKLKEVSVYYEQPVRKELPDRLHSRH